MLADEVIDDVVAWAIKSQVPTPCYLFSPAGVRTGVSQLRESLRAASKSRDHDWVVRRHSETGVFESGLVDAVGGWGGCGG